jgi:hypothetical protein
VAALARLRESRRRRASRRMDDGPQLSRRDDGERWATGAEEHGRSPLPAIAAALTTITSPTNPVPWTDVIQRRIPRIAISIGPFVDFHDWPPLTLYQTSISHEIATEQTISPPWTARTTCELASMRAADRQAVIACSPPPFPRSYASWLVARTRRHRREAGPACSRPVVLLMVAKVMMLMMMRPTATMRTCYALAPLTNVSTPARLTPFLAFAVRGIL